MYIDPELIDYITNEVGSIVDVENIIEECGHWYPINVIKEEFSKADTSLEYIFSECYYTVDENKMLFCPIDQFSLEDIERYTEKRDAWIIP